MLSKLTKVYEERDHSVIALLPVYYGMDGRDVVLVTLGKERGRMTITGDVLGNGMNRLQCQKALFEQYRQECGF